MTVNIILLVTFVVAAMVTVSTARVIRSAIALAATSAVLSVLMFRLNSPLAAVFELSVCAGLIPAILVSIVGLTGRLGPTALAARRKEKLRLYGALPLIVAVAAVLLWQIRIPLNIAPPDPAAEHDVRNVLWNLRHADLLGQIGVLAAAAFGAVILVKGGKRD